MGRSRISALKTLDLCRGGLALLGRVIIAEPTDVEASTWTPRTEDAPQAAWHGVFWDSLLLNASVAILGVAGMVAARRFRDRQGGLAVLAASVALPFIATAVTDRYTLPLRWLLLMYAGASVWILFRWRRGVLLTTARTKR
jgi:hypothetical protein